MPLKPYGINPDLAPSGAGWWFPQPFSDGIQRIPASGCTGSAEKLCEEVLRFRSREGIPLGDYKAEIAAHMAKVSPLNRIDKRHPLPVPVPEKREESVPLITRVVQWLIEVSSRTPRVVRVDEADERAGVCLKCPHNVKWRNGCAPQVDSVILRGMALRQRPIYSHDQDLLACRIHSLFLPAAVFVDRDYLPHKTSDTPQPCWLPPKKP